MRNTRLRVVCALVLVFALVVAPWPAAAQEQAPEDQTAALGAQVAVRDQLIANQENLLNTYRCLFSVDTASVPGGCPTPDTIAPGAAPQNPTSADVAARDQLIEAQEALLNVYRCRFDADTHLIPGGCRNGVPAPTPEATSPTTAEPEASPASRPVSPAAAITVGGGFSCGIKADRTAVCWGIKHHVLADTPAGEFTAISAGFVFTCGIRADRTVVCWLSNHAIPDALFAEIRGDFPAGESPLDAPAGEFTAISAGKSHSCGIRADRTAVCWGGNYDGQADAPAGEFTAISASTYHSCGIRADRTAVCWGLNFFGRADAPAGEFTAISAGEYHSCGIRADRTAVCWGADDDAAADAPAGEFTAVSAGDGQSCGIRADRTAVCWGFPCPPTVWLNQCQGYSTAWWFGVPAGEFIAVAAGWQTCGIRVDRTAVCWRAPGPESEPPAVEFAS